VDGADPPRLSVGTEGNADHGLQLRAKKRLCHMHGARRILNGAEGTAPLLDGKHEVAVFRQVAVVLIVLAFACKLNSVKMFDFSFTANTC
jgi:hypothetical protein